MTPAEKVAYIKGLAEGMGLDTEKGEGKLISSIIDVLEDLAYGLEDVEADVTELNDGLDAVSDDLSDVEDVVFGDDEDEEDEDEDDDDYEFTTVCPACGADIELSIDELKDGSVECPVCGEELELDVDDDDDDEDDDEVDSDF